MFSFSALCTDGNESLSTVVPSVHYSWPLHYHYRSVNISELTKVAQELSCLKGTIA
jgi:hypothetical protein